LYIYICCFIINILLTNVAAAYQLNAAYLPPRHHTQYDK